MAGTIKPLVESLASHSDDRRGAFAASAIGGSAVASEFYVVRDATTRKCTVGDTKPATTSVTIVDIGTFKARTEAGTVMKTIKVCTSN